MPVADPARGLPEHVPTSFGLTRTLLVRNAEDVLPHVLKRLAKVAPHLVGSEATTVVAGDSRRVVAREHLAGLLNAESLVLNPALYSRAGVVTVLTSGSAWGYRHVTIAVRFRPFRKAVLTAESQKSGIEDTTIGVVRTRTYREERRFASASGLTGRRRAFGWSYLDSHQAGSGGRHRRLPASRAAGYAAG